MTIDRHPAPHDDVPSDPHDVPAVPGPDLPPRFPELPAHLHDLYHSPAPAFPTTGTALRARLKQAANVALNLVGLSQRRFNEALLETLTLLMAEIRGLRGWVEQRAPLLPNAPDLAANLDALRSAVQGLRLDVRHLRDHVAAVAEAVASEHARVEAIGRSVAGLEPMVQEQSAAGRRVEELHAAQEDYRSWLTTLQRKYEALSLEARAIVEDRSLAPPAPQIVDPAGYARRVAGMPDGLRVNLGCGEQPWPDYVNVDLRPLPGVEVVADARRLPFEPGSLAELTSAHLVEHFREHQLRSRILPYWRTLLRPDGRLRIICPNWEAMLERLQDARMPLTDFKLITFGLQDYDGDDHFAMYTPDTLTALLESCGFGQVEVVARDRINGLCPEMELVARP